MTAISLDDRYLKPIRPGSLRFELLAPGTIVAARIAHGDSVQLKLKGQPARRGLCVAAGAVALGPEGLLYARVEPVAATAVRADAHRAGQVMVRLLTASVRSNTHADATQDKLARRGGFRSMRALYTHHADQKPKADANGRIERDLIAWVLL